jgi:hypothetical protein
MLTFSYIQTFFQFEFNFFEFCFFSIISDWETEYRLANYLQISQLHSFEADFVRKVIVEELFFI